MSNMRKYRHEIKFTISKSYADILKQRLSLLMDVDKNGENGYLIRSLYFDTPNSKAYYEKLDGVEYRKKYRIRIYNKDDSFIRLERKLKHNNLTSKDQTIIDKNLCEAIVNNKISIFKTNDKLLNEFLIDMKLNVLRPSIMVDYYRLALTYPVSDVRVTFDYNIKSGKYNYNLFDYNTQNYDIMDKDMLVLEVKFNDILPEAIAIILSTVPICRQAFSKFAECRSIK